MPAYVIIRAKTNDTTKLKPYQDRAPAIIKQYGGKILARGGDVVTLEGPIEERRIVLIEFQSMDDAKKFYHSQEYGEAISLRKDVAEFELIAINGLT